MNESCSVFIFRNNDNNVLVFSKFLKNLVLFWEIVKETFFEVSCAWLILQLFHNIVLQIVSYCVGISFICLNSQNMMVYLIAFIFSGHSENCSKSILLITWYQYVGMKLFGNSHLLEKVEAFSIWRMMTGIWSKPWRKLK